MAERTGMMLANSLLNGLGLFTCIGALVLVVLVALAIGSISNPAGSDPTGAPPNMWREMNSGSREPASDERSGRVPATGRGSTGSADQIIGSSGFDVRQQGGPPPAERKRFAEGDD